MSPGARQGNLGGILSTFSEKIKSDLRISGILLLAARLSRETAHAPELVVRPVPMATL